MIPDNSDINNLEFFAVDNNPNITFSPLLSLREEEDDYSHLCSYDNYFMQKIQYEENEALTQNICDIKKIPGMEEIIPRINESKNQSNYSDKSTNEKEKETEKPKFLLNKKKKDIFYTKILPKKKKLFIQINNFNQPEKRGRISKNDNKKGKHNKFSGDNIINKIKVHVFNYLRDIIRKNSPEQIDLKKIGNKFCADLRVKKNMKLYKMKIKDILTEIEISTKYSKKDKLENKKIIEEIYRKQRPIQVIKILELTFEEILILFRKNLNAPQDKRFIETTIENKIKGLDLLYTYKKYEDIEYLIDKIKEKYGNKISQEELEEYISSIKDHCLKYISWFENKKIRP